MSIGTSDLSKIIGLSRQRINQLARKGKITREPDGNWDPEKVAKQLGKNMDARGISKKAASKATAETKPKTRDENPDKPLSERTEEELGTTSLFEAQRLHEIAKGKKAEMEVQKLKGKLIDAYDTFMEYGGMIVAARNRALLIPATAAPKVAASSDVLECQQIIDREIRSFLTEISEYRPNV